MVRQLRLSLLIWLYCCMSFPLFAADEFSLKATFLYRFAQYTQWPPPPRGQTRFCLVEQPELLEAFTRLGVVLDVKELQHGQDLSQCDVLMLGLSDRQSLQRWQPLLAKFPLLIVTDNAEAYRQLGMIQLLTSPDGINFQVNLQRASAHQIKLGSQLLKLAQQVD